ncbi:hypothetical protein FS837_009336 [Tulasnella sp. UAMH 9824]|nr:hypothetical protein FS837_009336 [Tulasnella sp. UAMH 9824]
MASESSAPKREFLPASYYDPFISVASKARKPSPIRGLYPLESIPGMISLLAGKPAPQTFPVTSISVTVRSPFDPTQETQLMIKDEALAESLQYTATKGIPSLLNWVDRLQQIHHNRYSAGEGWGICVGTGSQDLLYKAFHALLNPGDPVFIEAPVYGGVIPILEALRCELVEIPTDAEGVKTADLRTMLESWPEARLRPRVIYTVPYGCNPTGTTASLERRKELLALARQYDFLILEDDPYYYLYYGEQERPPSYFKLETEDGHPVGQVVRFDSLSKILSAGFVSGPSLVVDAIATHTSSANLQTSSTSQAIAFAMLSHFGYEGFEKHTEHVSRYYRQKRDVFEAAMNKHLTGLVEWSTPVSGMFIWFKLKLRPTANSPEGDSAALIRERAVAKGVLALPGTAFFPNGQTSAYVRAAFSLLEPEDADEAMRRLALVIKEYNAEGEQT